MKKRLLVSLVALGLVGSVTGCGGKKVQNVPTKQIILKASQSKNLSTQKNLYSGIAHYEKRSMLGNSKSSYKMKIDFTGEVVILSLPEYKCKTKLLLVSKHANVSTYSEEYIQGPCRVDSSASTQIRVEEDKIDYLWQSGNEKLTAKLLKK